MGLPERTRAYLTGLARRRGTITYRDLAKALEVLMQEDVLRLQSRGLD